MGSPELDIGLAASGGARFLERVDQLINAKDAHDRALADLNLGRGAAAAYVHADELRKRATETHTAASKVLSNAEAKSATTLDAARVEAARIIAVAKTEAATLKAEGERLKADAAADAAASGQVAIALKQSAQKLKDEAQVERSEVAAAMEQIVKDRNALALERKNFEARQERFNLHYGRVATAMREAAHALV